MLRITMAAIICILTACDADPQFPDLRFGESPAVTPSDPIDGDTITIAFTIHNAGDDDTGPFTWRVIRSGVGIIREGYVPHLYEDDETSLLTVTIDETGGTHSYTIIIDVFNEVDEGLDLEGEADNERTLVVEVAPSAGA